jgi:hypothetical protein
VRTIIGSIEQHGVPKESASWGGGARWCGVQWKDSGVTLRGWHRRAEKCAVAWMVVACGIYSFLMLPAAYLFSVVLV